LFTGAGIEAFCRGKNGQSQDRISEQSVAVSKSQLVCSKYCSRSDETIFEQGLKGTFWQQYNGTEGIV